MDWHNSYTLKTQQWILRVRELLNRFKIIKKQSWHLPTLVAGVMHNIEPAHHALQQEGGFAKGKELKQPITRVIRKISFNKEEKIGYYGNSGM